MIAVVLGLVTAYVGMDMLKKAKGGAATASKVVVATRDMEPGYVIEATDLKLEDIPAGLIPAKALRDPKLATGRTILATVVKGFPLLDNQLSAPGTGTGMQAMIPKGMRAFAVEASEGSAAAGLITPGSFVDVIATLRKGDQPISMAVVQKAKVQFVSRSKAMRSASASAATGSPDSLGPIKSVTLLVTPKQANALELAQNQGKLKLVLRGNADDAEVGDSAITQNEMLGLPNAEPKPEPVVVEKPAADAFADPVQPPVDNRRAVQMIRGGTESTIYFDPSGNQSSEEGSGGAPATAQKSSQKQPPAASKPQKPQQPTPPDSNDGEAKTASGASPDDSQQAPRSDVGSGTLR
jgi:pilus assembly protein CpaB